MGAKVTWHGNVVYCSLHRTFDENVRACLAALAFLSHVHIEEIRRDPYTKIERYRSS